MNLQVLLRHLLEKPQCSRPLIFYWLELRRSRSDHHCMKQVLTNQINRQVSCFIVDQTRKLSDRTYTYKHRGE